jgi:hypothetical protein
MLESFSVLQDPGNDAIFLKSQKSQRFQLLDSDINHQHEILVRHGSIILIPWQSPNGWEPGRYGSNPVVQYVGK